MEKYSLYFRAFKEYQKYTSNDSACKSTRNNIINSNPENNILECTTYKCFIDEDWVIEIENTIEAISECIAQNREFIRTNGDIVIIEKAKSVSRASTVHLAKHTELITRKPKEDDILIPEKIFMEEKLSDYAIYENRFLYTLVDYLKDFIELRIKEIEETINTYIGFSSMNKKVVFQGNFIEFEFKFKEYRNDILSDLIDEETFNIIDRIRKVYADVKSFLKSTLLMEVSKSPKIKPPVVKTNVLKSNKYFRKIVLLYDYIMAYEGDGYEKVEVKNSIRPLNDKMNNEFSEIAQLLSLLTLEHSNNKLEKLNEIYELEEEKNREILEEFKIEKIKILRKKVYLKEITLEEYMVELEERNKELEPTRNELIEVKEKNLELNEKIVYLNEIIELNKLEILAYQEEIYNLKEEHKRIIEELTVKHQNEITELTTKYKDEILALINNHNKQMTEIQQKHVNEKNKLIFDYTQEIQLLNNNHVEKLNDLNSKYKKEIESINLINEENLATLREENLKMEEEFNDKIQEKNILLESVNSECLKMGAQLSLLKEENYLFSAQLKSYRYIKNDSDDSVNYTDKDEFKKIEEEFIVFKKFMNEKWKETKSRIRKEAFAKNTDKK